MTDQPTLTWLLQSVFAVAMFFGGALVYWIFTRLSSVEGKQDAAREAANNVKDRVGVIETRVTVLEDGKRFRFDIRTDRTLLEKQIAVEVEKQLDEQQPEKKP